MLESISFISVYISNIFFSTSKSPRLSFPDESCIMTSFRFSIVFLNLSPIYAMVKIGLWESCPLSMSKFLPSNELLTFAKSLSELSLDTRASATAPLPFSISFLTMSLIISSLSPGKSQNSSWYFNFSLSCLI